MKRIRRIQEPCLFCLVSPSCTSLCYEEIAYLNSVRSKKPAHLWTYIIRKEGKWRLVSFGAIKWRLVPTGSIKDLER